MTAYHRHLACGSYVEETYVDRVSTRQRVVTDDFRNLLNPETFGVLSRQASLRATNENDGVPSAMTDMNIFISSQKIVGYGLAQDAPIPMSPAWILR